MNPMVSVDEVAERLKLIFGDINSLALTNATAVATVYTMLYVDAIDGANPIRPTTVAWMNDEIAANQNNDVRARYYAAARRSKAARNNVVKSLGYDPADTWYADNSREGIRDDCLRNALVPNGAVIRDRTAPPTSSAGVWSLKPSFAALFDPGLVDDELAEQVATWQDANLSRIGLTRTEAARRQVDATSIIETDLPDHSRLLLPPGEASVITRDVIEVKAPRRLSNPAVLFVAHSDMPVPTEFAALTSTRRCFPTSCSTT